MITLRQNHERGHANFGWLDTYHTFSFGHYHDPAHMGFGSLRVINDDRVAPGGGFPEHPHRDMEIVTYILDGQLAHRDSMGNGSVIRKGDVQRMTAGRGITHSEYNASEHESVHLLQIWIIPQAPGLEPGYEQKYFDPESKRNRLRLVASSTGRDESVLIHQDADLYAALLEADQTVEHTFAPGRRGYLQLASGAITVNGTAMSEGDGAKLSDVDRVVIRASTESEFLLFDLA